VAIEALTDLPKRLEHVGSRTFDRAPQALPDHFVVQAVNLALGERQSLFEWEIMDEPFHQGSRLARDQHRFRPGLDGLARGGAHLVVGFAAASL